MIIRKAKSSDLKDITEIYNDAVKNTVATFDLKPKTVDEQRIWFKEHGSKNPILVAEQDGVIVGWVSLSKYDDKLAYSDTVELSLYVKEGFQGQGIGKKLMEKIIEEGKKAGVHVILVRITDGNKISTHLHEKFGFKHVGVLKQVGFKFGRYLDVYIMQKILD